MDERTKNLDLKGLFLLCDKWGVKKYGTKEMIRKRLAAVMPKEIPDEIPEVVEEFSTDWSKEALMNACEKRSISKAGNKPVLVERLKKYESSKALEKNSSLSKASDKTSSLSNPSEKQSRSLSKASDKTSSLSNPSEKQSRSLSNKVDYVGWKKDELKTELKSRRLNTAGNVKELRERLKTNDETKETIQDNIEKNFEEKVVCESCSNNEVFLTMSSKHATADWYCQDCSEKICTQCKVNHARFRLLKEHKIFPLNPFLHKTRVIIPSQMDQDIESLELSISKMNINDEMETEKVWYSVEKNVDDIINLINLEGGDTNSSLISPISSLPRRSFSTNASFVPETPAPISRNSSFIPETPAPVSRNSSFVPETPVSISRISSLAPVSRNSSFVPETPLSNSRNSSFVPETPAQFLEDSSLVQETPTTNSSKIVLSSSPDSPDMFSPTPIKKILKVPTRQLPNLSKSATWSLSSSPLGPSSPLPSSPPMESSPPFRSHSEICELSSQVKQSEKVAAACIEEFIANNNSEIVEPEKTKATPAEVPKQFKTMVSDDYKQLTLKHNPDAAWTKSKDGNDILFDSGFTYKVNKPYTKKNGEEVKHLRCTVEICSAKNALNDGVLKSRDHGGHKCEPDPTKLARLDALHKAREAARNTHLKPSEICSKVLEEMPEEARKHYGGHLNMNQKINYVRQKERGPMAKTLKDLDPGVIKLKDGTLFLQYDNQKENNRIMVFASPSGLQLLADSEDIAQDGTFQVTPSVQEGEFGQFYVFHGQVNGYTERKGLQSYTFPLVFCLMEHRSQKDYEEILDWLTTYWNENGAAIRVCQGGDSLTDMEPAIVQAEKIHLPGCNCKICMFHLAQVTLTKVTDLGLKREYMRNEDFAKDVRMINGMALVPEVAVSQAWEQLEKYLLDKNSKALAVWKHWDVMFVRGWTDERTLVEHPPVWPPSMWNMYSRTLSKKARTTNSLESWHRRLNTLLERHRRFEEFVDALIKEWCFIETNIQHVKSGQAHLVKKTMSKQEEERESRIFNVVSNCGKGYRDAIDYLSAIADASKKVGH